MSFAKSGLLTFFALLFLVSNSARAQSAGDDLRGYTPPPMFGGTSKPLSPPVAAPAPVVETPSPAPAMVTTPPAQPPAPAPVTKPAAKVTTPPSDKEQVVKDEPLPIEPLTPRTKQKPTKPPADKEKIPAYIAPVKKPAVKPSLKAKAKTPAAVLAAPETNMQAAPALDKAATGGVSAESLLGHAVTTSETDTASPGPDLGPLSAPMPKMGDTLVLPGTVPAQKKITATKTAKPKAEIKKPDVKKSEAKKSEVQKTEPKITKVIPAPATTKPVAVAPVAKPEFKKEIIPAKPVMATPTPALHIPPQKSETPKKVEQKAYNIKGSKSMPTAMPGKVERTELTKTPLPPVESDPKLKSTPTPNEQMIDQSLQDHLVQPDVSKIISAAPVAKTPDVKDKTKFKNPVGANPPPVIMMNKNSVNDAPLNKGAVVNAPIPAPQKEKVKPQLVSLEFKDQATELPADLKKTIDDNIVPKLSGDKYARLQILAYASPTKDGQSSARRISLARGLAIRSYMLEKGVEPGRIDIRALGENSAEKPLDRADLMIISYKQ